MTLPIIVALATEENPYTYLNPGGAAFNLSVLIIGLLLGGLLATIATVFYQRIVNRFFIALRREGATSPKTAKTLDELGFKPMFGMRRALLSRTSIVRKLTSVVLEDGRVLEPLHSFDDDVAAEESEASAIHADEIPEKTPTKAVDAAAEDGENAQNDGDAAAEPHEIITDSLHFDVMRAAYFLDELHRRRAEIRFEKRGNDLRFLIPATVAFVILFATLPVYLPYFAKMLDGLLSLLLGGSA